MKLRGLIIVLIVFIIGSLYGVQQLERSLLYHPVQSPYPVMQKLQLEEVSFHSTLGNTIYAAYKKTNSEDAILFFHGNAGNINANESNLIALLNTGRTFLMSDYPGYGQSTGTPSEESLYDTARAGYEFLQSQGYTAENIIINGQSLGGAVAVQLATEVAEKSLIVESSFTSTHGMADELLPWLPKIFLPKKKFDSMTKISQVDSPVLFLHGDSDQTIPKRHAEELYEQATDPKFLILLPDLQHNSDKAIIPGDIQKQIELFLETGTTSAKDN